MRFPYWFPVDRHGLSALAMTRWWGMTWAVRVHHTLSLRGGSEARDAAIHRVSKEAYGCRFAYWLTVDRHGLRPRDDKTGKMEYYEWTLKKLKIFVLNILLFDIWIIVYISKHDCIN